MRKKNLYFLKNMRQALYYGSDAQRREQQRQYQTRFSTIYFILLKATAVPNSSVTTAVATA
jgi:hypothetical protein